MAAQKMQEQRMVSTQLAQAASSTHWQALPADVRERALDLFLDGLAVIAGAAGHSDMKSLLRQFKPATGPVTLIAENRGVHIRDAVMLNAAATTMLQRQDGYANAKGHPASHLVPVLLAIAERDNQSATAMLSAFVAGYEICARVGMALGDVPPWLHDNGNWATIGVAASAAHLLSGGDAKRIADAIDGVSSLALYFDRFTTVAGATIHHMYPAMATLNALSVAEAAVAGLQSMPGSLERFYGPRLGTAFDAARLSNGIENGVWSAFEILNSYFKLHPTCAHMHGVNDAVDMLIAEAGLTEGNVESIEVETFKAAMEIDAEHPHNDLAARFSIRAAVAAAIRYGRLDDEGFENLDVLSPLMARIHARHNPELDQFVPAGRPGVVTVRLRDGRTFSRKVIYPRGTPQAPASKNERHTKAMTLLKRHYGADSAKHVMATALTLGSSASISDLTEALRSA